MRTVRRYVLSEIISPFSLGLFVITVLFLIQKIILLTEWAVNRGVGALDMARLILFLLPLILLIVIPMTSLFSILIAMGRLSSDSEVVALKASGISLRRLLVPALMFSFFTMSLGLYTSLDLMPKANQASRVLRYRIIKTRSEQGLPVGTFINFIPKMGIYVREKDQDGLKGVILTQEEFKKEKIDGKKIKTLINRNVAFAERVQVESDPVDLTISLVLYNGQVHLQDFENDVYHTGSFGRARVRIDWEGDEVSRREKQMELSGLDLFFQTRDLKQELEKSTNLEPKERNKLKQKLIEFSVMLYERLVFPVGCLALCFWGLPLGISPPRSGTTRSILMGVVLSMLFYYLIVVGKAMALKGYVSPELGMWTPILLVFLSGVYLLRQRTLERPVFLLSRLEDETYYRIDQLKAWWQKKRGTG